MKTATLAAIALVIILGLGYWAVTKNKDKSSLTTQESQSSTTNPDQEEDAVLKESADGGSDDSTPANASRDFNDSDEMAGE